MSITEEENLLFEEWSKFKEGFVSDGIVNLDEWNKSKIKIVYVLKEANDPDGEKWDLRELVANGERPQTWDNIARWSYGIKNLNQEILWKDLSVIDKAFRKDSLKSICVVNLKKAPGIHTTNNNELNSHAELEKEYLRKQFELYKDADLIICCGSIVSKIFHNLVNDYPAFNWEKTSRGIDYHKIGKDKFLFSFLHPEVRIGTFDNILYYGLVDSIREVMNNTTEK